MMQLPKPKIQNHFPNSVAMKLHFIESDRPNSSPSEAANSGKEGTLPGLSVMIDILFRKQQEIRIPGGTLLGFPGGQAKFGLRRGQLHLQPHHCSISIESKMLSKPFHVTTTEETLTWTFEAQDEQMALEGALVMTKLGILQITSTPSQVDAEFWAQREDIRLNFAKVNIPQGINRNKLAVIERVLALQYIGPYIESNPLSEIGWNYDE